MAKLAYAPDLGSGGVIHAGSTPVTRTSGESPRIFRARSVQDLALSREGKIFFVKVRQ